MRHETIADVLGEVRARRTQSDMGDIVGVKGQTWGRYERGRPVSAEIVEKLCRWYATERGPDAADELRLRLLRAAAPFIEESE